MARTSASRLTPIHRVPRPSPRRGREPALILTVTLIIALAPIGWLNAVSQLFLPTSVPTPSGRPLSVAEPRRGGATFDIIANDVTATPTVPPRPTSIAARETLEMTTSESAAAPTTEAIPSTTATPLLGVVEPTAVPPPSPAAEPESLAPRATATPDEPASAPATPTPPPVPTASPTPRPTDPPAASATPTTQARAATPTVAVAGAPGTYVVQTGDTLWSIARRYGVDLGDLRRANQIGDDNAIRVGQTLAIPRGDATRATTLSADLLSDVAQEYGVAPETVARASQQLSVSAPVSGEPRIVAAAGPERASPTPARASSAAERTAGNDQRGELRSASRRTSASARLQWPALGGISTFFGEEGHSGLDIMGVTGQPVYAAAAGVVTNVSKSEEGYGWRIDVDHGTGVTTLYAHLSEMTVAPGDRVGAGQRIGAVGSTGLSTGPHLHFEVRAGGSPVDPLDYLR